MPTTPFSPEQINSVIQGALRRVCRPEWWSVGQMAVTSTGEKTLPESPDAVRWCAYGAIRAEAFAAIRPVESDPIARGHAMRLAEHASKHVGAVLFSLKVHVQPTDAPRTVMEWNDGEGRQHADVIRIFKHALKTTLAKPVSAAA